MENKDMMDILYPKEFICPNCGKSSYQTMVRSKYIKVKKTHTHFINEYETVNPLFYDIWLCEYCGLAVLSKDAKKLDEYKLKKVKENITPKWKKVHFPLVLDIDNVIKRYKYALLNYMIMGEKISKQASLALRLSWFYRLKGDSALEQSFLEKALAGYLQAYREEQFPSENLTEPHVMYLIGELHRMTGNKEEALKWFSKVLVDKRADNRLKELTRDQRDLIRGEKP